MTKLTAIVLALTAGASCATKADKWRTQDTILELGFQAALAADAYQAGGVTKDCRESNPLVGECGDNGGVLGTWLLFGVTHAAVSSALGHRARTIWQAVTLGAEANQVLVNYKMGY